MSKLRWGVLSTAKIGVDKVIPAMQRAEHCGDRGHRLARRRRARRRRPHDWESPRAHGSYEELLADPAGRRGLQSAAQPLARALVDRSARGRQARAVREADRAIGRRRPEAGRRVAAASEAEGDGSLHVSPPSAVAAGQGIGARRGHRPAGTIQSFFSYYNDDAANIRNQVEIGGGGLADIGCYCISLARFIFDAEPRRVLGIVEYDPKFKTDRLASGILEFGGGTSTFTCGTQLAPVSAREHPGDRGTHRNRHSVQRPARSTLHDATRATRPSARRLRCPCAISTRSRANCFRWPCSTIGQCRRRSKTQWPTCG